MNYIVGYAFNVPADMRINFTDWETCTNGNVLLLILLTAVATALCLVAAGIKKELTHR